MNAKLRSAIVSEIDPWNLEEILITIIPEQIDVIAEMPDVIEYSDSLKFYSFIIADFHVMFAFDHENMTIKESSSFDLCFSLNRFNVETRETEFEEFVKNIVIFEK